MNEHDHQMRCPGKPCRQVRWVITVVMMMCQGGKEQETIQAVNTQESHRCVCGYCFPWHERGRYRPHVPSPAWLQEGKQVGITVSEAQRRQEERVGGPAIRALEQCPMSKEKQQPLGWGLQQY